MRLPLSKVPALAQALSADARIVLRLAMAETMPGLYELVEEVMNPLALRQHEVGLIKHCRKLTGDRLAASVVIGNEL